jgi:hypothetical protein
MQMKPNKPWAFALAPQPCEAILKKFIGEFLVKLWTLIVSHDFFV